ncbi:MAG: hypothetical protein J6Q76_08165 [Clostridia bacterium]|nr:hypothetical protein [Clostridia bacterium]
MQPIYPVQPIRPAEPPKPTFSEIKSAAKGTLKHRWTEGIAVSLVLLATSLLNMVMQAALQTIFKVDTVWSPMSPTDVPLHSVIASVGITLFSAIFTLIVMLPLLFGALRWFWLVTGGSDPGVGEVFYYFSSARTFFKALGISVSIFWRLILGTVLCFLPYATISVLTNSEFYNFLEISMPTYMSSLYSLGAILEMLGFFLLLLWVSGYAMFYVAMFSEPELSTRQTIKLTVRLSKQNRLRFVGFFFTFFGWLLLSFLILPLLYFLPFFMASLCIYGREVYRSSQRNAFNTAPYDR